MSRKWQLALFAMILIGVVFAMTFDRLPIRSALAAGPTPTPDTRMVSVSSTGEQGNLESVRPSISSDGRYVAFPSFASNLVDGDTNGVADAFVHDLETGQTSRVSVSTTGEQGNKSSGGIISADGRYVVIASEATNLAGEDTNLKTDIFVHDRQTGQTSMISVSSAGQQGNDSSNEPSISSDGRYVAFRSRSSNLVDGDTNGEGDVFVHDLETGQTSRVSVSSTGQQGNADSNGNLTISADGRYVAFQSRASNLVSGDTNGDNSDQDLFVHDRQTGQTTRVSVNSLGEQDSFGSNEFPTISADGRYVAFGSTFKDLVEDDNNVRPDVFVHDRVTGETTRMSVSSSGQEGDKGGRTPSISADGRYVAFSSRSTNLVAGTTGDQDAQIFVHDRITGQTSLVSVSSSGEKAKGVERDVDKMTC